MSVQFSPIGNGSQFFTVNGVPLNAGTLTTYSAGTSTPQATFTTSAGSIQNSNPIVLGVDGRPPQEIWLLTGQSYKFVLADSLGNILSTYDNVPGISSGGLPNSYLSGLIMSSAGASTTVAVTAGQATDSTNAVPMTLASAMSKTTAGWAAGSGNGGLDTGAIAPSSWYHFFLIYRADTGVTDILFSLSVNVPLLPSNYTNFRRIGSAKTKTGGSPNWEGFVQDGDYFQWIVPASQGGATTRPLDFGTTNPGTAAVTVALAVPPGVNVLAQLKLRLFNADATETDMYVSDLATQDAVPQAVPGALAQIINIQTAANLSQVGAATVLVRTDTAQSIRYRLSYSSANVTAQGAVTGWFDRRGRDS